MEFVSDPITTKAVTGYDANGKDVWEEITVTSLKMRSLGGELTSTENHMADLCDYRNGKFPTLMMKDGSAIRLMSELTPYDDEYLGNPISLDEIDHLLLIDGTKLYPQK